MCRISGNRSTWCGSRRSVRRFLRDHLGVQASSIDSPEQQRLTIEKFLQANAYGPGATPMDVDAPCQDQDTKGGKKGGRTRSLKPRNSAVTACGVEHTAM